MKVEELRKLVQEIVEKAAKLKDKYTGETDAPVNYACVFAQSQDEYSSLLHAAKQLGTVIKETPTGPLFQIKPLQTAAGPLQILKVRKLDKTRPERGDADFTVLDYPSFKKRVLGKKEFKLIKRQAFEMIELVDPDFNVRVYFSHPPLDQQFALV